MRKKIVGISGGYIQDSSGRFNDYKKAYVNDDYIKVVEKAGGIPVILPIVTSEDLISGQLDLIDVLIISGGDDINPYAYGEPQLQKNGVPVIERDWYDFRLFKIAKNKNIPILGICRGLQIINVALGGSLYQDLSYVEGCKIKHDQWSIPHLASHKVNINNNTILEKLYGNELDVNSFHHQVIKKLGDDLTISATSTDGVIEAIEGNDKNYFLVAVQWHPEMMAAKGNAEMLKLFTTLINKG